MLVLVASFVIGFAYSASAGVASDADGDAIPDVLDKCMLDSRNATAPSTCDVDVDGYGNVCDGDFDQNNAVNATDFTMLFIPAFKGNDPSPWPQGMDMDCNGAVNATDFTMYFIPRFKAVPAVPGPSGLSCAGQSGCAVCISCNDCAGNPCVNGACSAGCTSDDQCCAPKVCASGSCQLILPP
jgi:hypothetical protein